MEYKIRHIIHFCVQASLFREIRHNPSQREVVLRAFHIQKVVIFRKFKSDYPFVTCEEQFNGVVLQINIKSMTENQD